MAKICKRCRKPASQENLFCCDRDGCRGEFILEAELVTYLSNDDIKLVAKRVVRSLQFWGALVLALVTLVPATLIAISKFWMLPRMEKAVDTYQSNAVQRLTNRVESSVSIMAQESSNRLARLDASFRRTESNVYIRLNSAFEEVTNRIVAEFQDSRIKETVNNVASLQAKELMEQRISPQVAEFTNELAIFRSKAETNITELKGAASLALLLTKALSDDRVSFDELVKLREKGSSNEQSIAASVVGQIVGRLEDEANSRNGMINVWDGTTNSAATATLEQYKARYRELPPIPRMYLIHDLYTHGQFSLYGRLGFLVQVAQNDPSLQCAYQACRCLGDASKLNYNLLGVPLYVEWWNKNMTNYFGK